MKRRPAATPPREKAQRERLGRALRQAREGAGVPQRELAKRIGQTWASISDYESGRRAPPALTLFALCRALDADLGGIAHAVLPDGWAPTADGGANGSAVQPPA